MAIGGHAATFALVGLWVWFVAWAVALSVVDVREHRLPNVMVGWCLAGTLVWVGALAWALADPSLLLRGVGAAAVSVLVFAVGHFAGGMGMGDVKYAAVTGLALGTLGWAAVWWGHLLGFVLAGGVVVVGIATGRMHRGSAIPFGPFMAVGAAAVGFAALAGVVESVPSVVGFG